MKRRVFVCSCLVLVVFVLFFAGCGPGGGGGGSTTPSSYTVSGRVTQADNGQGIEGVTLTFSGGFGSTTTDSNGNWSKSGLSGTVTVTPSKEGWTFSPASRQVTGAASDVNFTGMQSFSCTPTISGGGYHSLALKKDGTVWAWGHNEYGQLGDGTQTLGRLTPVQVSGLSGVIAIAAGEYHSLALKSDGTVWAWGGNYEGQLGDGTTNNKLTPVQVSGLSGVIAIAASYRHSLALKSDGTVWAWGSNW